jgi:hypothetical protein
MNKRKWMIGSALAVLVNGNMVAAPKYQQDQDGNLAPCMSYAQFIERGMRFVLKDLDGGWAIGNAYKDKNGTPVPGYVNYAVADAKRQLGVGHPVNANTVYPAFHHALYIRTFLTHWQRTNAAGASNGSRASVNPAKFRTLNVTLNRVLFMNFYPTLNAPFRPAL